MTGDVVSLVSSYRAVAFDPKAVIDKCGLCGIRLSFQVTPLDGIGRKCEQPPANSFSLCDHIMSPRVFQDRTVIVFILGLVGQDRFIKAHQQSNSSELRCPLSRATLS